MLNENIQVPLPSTGIIKARKKKYVYVYHVLNTYRNEKGQPTNDRVLIGRLNEETNMLIPNNRYYEYYDDSVSVQMLPSADAVKSFGAYFLLHTIIQQLGIDNILLDVLGERRAGAAILTAIYMVSRGNVMEGSADWCENCVPGEYGICSQSTSSLFSTITYKERMHFFRAWIQRRMCSEYLAYDVTSFSSYAEGIKDVEWGYNRDGDKLPQINLAMYLGQRSRLPVLYNTYPGSIVDKSHLPSMMSLNKELGITDVSFVLDRGFCSTKNVQWMANEGITFILGVDIRSMSTKRAVDSVAASIRSERHHITGDVFACSVHDRFYGVTATMHVFYDMTRAVEQSRDLRRRVETQEETLSQLTELTKRQRKQLSAYFMIQDSEDGGFTYEKNYEAIDAAGKYNGFFCLLSNDSLTSSEVFSIYRDKDSIEKGFDDIKNHLDMKRLHTHTDETTDGKLFCAFLGLIISFELENKLSGYMDEKSMSKEKVIRELEKIKFVTASGKQRLLNPLTKRQRGLLAPFSVTEDTVKDFVAHL